MKRKFFAVVLAMGQAVLLLASTALIAQTELCTIKIGEDGETYTFQKSLGPGQYWQWSSVNESSFIRETSGPCYFTVYNGENFTGRYVIIGTNLDDRIRAGLDGVDNKDSGGGDTWKIRSLRITRPKSTNCRISIGGGGVRMDYYTGDYEVIPSMDRIGGFWGGDGTAAIWNYTNFGKDDYDNRFKFLHPTGDRNEAYDPGYRVRSMKIWDNGNDCPPLAKDKGRCLPQTLLRENVYVHQTNGTKGKDADLDLDKDGLVDRVENELAQAFRPIYVNHSTEDATRIQIYKDVNGQEVMEPITLFQVHPAGEGEIIIRYVRLWLYDRAETIFGACGGHKGDSQRHSIVLKTENPKHREYGQFRYVYKTGGGIGEEFNWEKRDGSIRRAHFENLNADDGPARHLVIYFSKGKHHEYSDGGWSGQTDKDCPNLNAHTNGRGDLHNPPYPKRIAIIRSPRGKGDRFDFNNVGSAAHPFFRDLSPFGFSGQHIWSGHNFYEADPIARAFE